MGQVLCQSKNYNRNPEFYYNKIKENQLDFDNEKIKQKVQLLISLSGCSSGSNYSVRLVSYSGYNESKLGETEVIKANQPVVKFNQFVVMEYYFEKEQPLGFIISKENQTSIMKTNLGRIMGSRGLIYSADISFGEKLIIQAKSVENNPYSALFEVSINGAFNSKPHYYLVKNLGSQSDPRSTMVYRSEIKENANSIRFNPVVIPTQYLCNGDMEKTFISIELYDHSQEKIGATSGTLNQLIAQLTTFNLRNTGGIKTATVTIKLKKDYTFLDYLRGGMQIGLTIGIDFTGSNKEPRHPQSLHNITNEQMNLYESAIKSCGDIVAYYDYDQLFPVYGYGAIIPGYNQVSHCFPLNGTIDANIQSINGILSCYRAIVPTLTFYGPTFFAPIINALNVTVKTDLTRGKEMNYNIMMILTDGQINDMNETINAVVEASYLPISIIIIGIGLGDFGNMDVLDADDKPLYDSRNRKAARDLVQFVPFHKFQNDGKRLSEEVLEEIPRQVCEYYQIKQIIPGDPIFNVII